MVIFLFIAGGLLIGFGAIVMITAIPATSWGASWPEVKSAFRTMAGTPRFQAGAACFAVGFLMLLLLFSLIMP